MRSDSNYIFYNDVQNLMYKMSEEFPEIVSVQTLGKSYQGRDIKMIQITSNQNSNSSLLITGAHHSRELSSIQLPLLTALKLCHGYFYNDLETIESLKMQKVLIIPIINVDGFNYISEIFEKTG